jgi:hypothetical protein
MVNVADGPWGKTKRKYPNRTHVSIDDDLIMKAFKSKMQDPSTTTDEKP